MFLREYLYVDTGVVRGILGQLESGVTEKTIEADSQSKQTQAGVKGLLGHAATWGDGTTTEKSMGDALFPRLELNLEAEGLLVDVSDDLQNQTAWESVVEDYPPGTILRISAPGSIFDARFIATILNGFVTATHGLNNVGAFGEDANAIPTLPPKAKTKSAQKGQYKPLPNEEASLEGGIALGKVGLGGDDDLEGKFLRGIIQVSRGIFAPGVHLALAPCAANNAVITARLQEGRQYLDTDPDVLFAHYGVGVQEWTVVGTVGHHPLPDPDMSSVTFMEDGIIQRSKFGSYVNQLATVLGNQGLSDLPQSPGFSLIPWAVYRTIGQSSGELEQAD